MSGRASLSRDKVKIEELWKPIVKTWFTEGVDDPRITVIKVAPTGGYYWDTKHGNAVAGVKICWRCHRKDAGRFDRRNAYFLARRVASLTFTARS